MTSYRGTERTNRRNAESAERELSCDRFCVLRDSAVRFSGFTLAELLTVIAIIALVGSLGAGAFHFARRNYSLAGSAGRIQGVLRAARNSALSTGSSSFVVVEPARKAVAAYVFEPVGEWSFDGGGGLARERVDGGSALGSAPGRIGKALDCRSGGSQVNAGSEARFDLRSSIFIAVWVQHYEFGEVKELPGERRRREKSGGARTLGRGGRLRVTPGSTRRSSEARTRGSRRLGGDEKSTRDEAARAIVSKKGAYFLGMTPTGALEGAIGKYRVRTFEPVVPPGRWVYVTLRYDGLELELSADGVPRPWKLVGTPSLRRSRADRDEAREDHRENDQQKDRERLPPVAPVTSAPLVISSSSAPFPGLIDEVRLAGATEPLVYEYSEFEHILGWKKVIHFDRHGHLDRRRHDGPVRIVLVELPDEAPGSSTSTEVVVDYSVTFAEWLKEWESPPADLTEAGEEAKLERRFESEGRIAITVEPLGTVTSFRLEDG